VYTKEVDTLHIRDCKIGIQVLEIANFRYIKHW